MKTTIDTATILRKLALHEPLFTSIPVLKNRNIMGTESEYGVATDANCNPIIDYTHLPEVLPNGGKIYIDQSHLEYASPETSNPVAAVAYYEAGKIICMEKNFSPLLYCNNNDWNKNTFGAHENYFTQYPRGLWNRLIPFLVTRTIFTGNGWMDNDGRFVISQRAAHIEFTESEETTSNRGIINLRHESLSDQQGWERFHVICGDATMSEISTFLRIGTLSMVMNLAEIGGLPDRLHYDNMAAIADLHAISRATDSWPLRGVRRGPSEAIGVQKMYLEQAKIAFGGDDAVTDILLVLWEDTLEKLRRDPQELYGRLDWVTKMEILSEFWNKTANSNSAWLQSQDMEYHSLNQTKKDGGLYYFLRDRGEMERLVSDSVLRRAVCEPPGDTRAYARGKIVQHLSHLKKMPYKLSDRCWQELTVLRKDRNAAYFLDEDMHFPSRRIDDPFDTYADTLKGYKAEIDASIL